MSCYRKNNLNIIFMEYVSELEYVKKAKEQHKYYVKIDPNNDNDREFILWAGSLVFYTSAGIPRMLMDRLRIF